MSAEKLTELFAKLSASGTPESAAEIVKATKSAGLASMATVSEQLKALLEDSKAAEGGLVAFSQLVAEFGSKSEPYLVPLLPQLLERASDKSPSVRAAAEAAATALFAAVNPYSTESLMQPLFDGMAQARGWQTKVLALQLLSGLAKTAPIQLCSCLHEIVPRLTGELNGPSHEEGNCSNLLRAFSGVILILSPPCVDTMSDAKEQVKTATTAALTATFAINGNRDITQFLPALIGCIARPVSETSLARE